MHDRIIRGGTVVDGTGAAPREADVAIRDGQIAEVGRVGGPAREEIDARGVTPTRLAQILVQHSGNSSVEHLVEQACTRLQELWIEQSSTNTYEASLAAELKAAGLLAKHVPEKFQFLHQVTLSGFEG